MKETSMGGHHYRQLAWMVVLSFASMYALMYAMVDRSSNVVHNWNQVFMAGLMAAPMAVIEVLLMRSMYTNRKLNAVVLGTAVLAASLCWLAVRRQALIDDRQLVRSMIPHHAGAILMCEQARLERADVQDLCRSIVESQQREIALMKTLLESAP